ncbi:MAG: hypothetical protein ACJAZB_000453 [Psychrosphaera sp.]|jgi:hypothetical protein
MNKLTVCIYLIILTMVSACNDNTGGSNTAANIASVNAGADKVVLEGLPITLDATVYPEGGNLVWVQTAGPFNEGFPTEGELTVDIVAPSVALDTELVFRAEYTSLDGQVVYDEVKVQVTNVDYPPVAIIKVDDTITQPFNTYEEITISGSDSYDLDGEVRKYLWTQIDNNNPLTFISDSTSSELLIVAPFVVNITNYTLQLTVTDNMGITGVNTIDIQIAASNSVIAANAGLDQTVDEFTRVDIDASSSVSSVSEVSCLWQQVYPTTTSVVFDDAEQCITSFVAPDVDAQAEYIFAVNVTDTADNVASDQMVVTINPINLGTLHDTGITSCFSDSKEIACNDPDYPNQDADTGRDEISTLLDKSGDGPRSFDFTKLDENGDDLPNDRTEFSCVRDNFTGLIWEVKQPRSIPEFQNLRGVDNYYSMDSSLEGLTSCPSESNCGQAEFIDNVNESGYCGGANWRLPTYLELLNILDYNDVDKSNLLVSEFFRYTPNSNNGNSEHQFYWVSDTSATGGGGFLNWVLDLSTGDDSTILMNKTAYVILVRTP